MDIQQIFTSGMRVHCIGVGGIGVSAVARWLLHLGVVVSGEDKEQSAVTARLESEGVRIGAFNGADAVVYSDAVPDSHAVLRSAREQDIPCYSYDEALAVLTTGYRTIAIAGTHGKSTTTALIGLLLEAAGVDPTVVVGTLVPQWGNTNFRAGGSDIAVVEADEHNRHFLKLSPFIIAVTNVDYDHVDVFPSREEYVAAFEEFIGRAAGKGEVVLPESDSSALKLHRSAKGALVHVWGVTDISAWNDGGMRFVPTLDGVEMGEFQISVPGEHMAANAATALATVASWDIPAAAAQKAIASFHGTWRRFESVGRVNGAEVVSDYAHHPAEIDALLAAARIYAPDARIVLVFQPHHRARAAAFKGDFIYSLCGADDVVLVDIYDVAGRQAGEKVDVRGWIPAIERQCRGRVRFVNSSKEAVFAIRAAAKEGTLILVAGAGDIDAAARLACGKT